MIRQNRRSAGLLPRNGASPPSETATTGRRSGRRLKRAGIDCVNGWAPVLVAALLAAAPAFADECSDFRDSIDMAIAANGYDAVVLAFSEAIDAWTVVQEADRWNSAADNLVPALAASKESADAASDTRDRVFQLQARSAGDGGREQAGASIRSLEDLYHKAMTAFFELLFFAHCGDPSRS